MTSSAPSAWDIVAAEFRCECAETQLVRFTRSNGSVELRRQCVACGGSKTVKKLELGSHRIEDLPEFDRELQRLKFQERNERAAELRQQQREEEKARWFQQHNEYLGSDRWRLKREAVLKRDKAICRACERRAATEVHHLTYDHWGDEPLFDLISICGPCHDKLTAMDRERRGY